MRRIVLAAQALGGAMLLTVAPLSTLDRTERSMRTPSPPSLEVLHAGTRVAAHVRSARKGGFTADPAHRPRGPPKRDQLSSRFSLPRIVCATEIKREMGVASRAQSPDCRIRVQLRRDRILHRRLLHAARLVQRGNISNLISRRLPWESSLIFSRLIASAQSSPSRHSSLKRL